MANAPSSSSSSRRQGDFSSIEQLCDEIYELHRPAQGRPNLEIVFFHGFQKEDYDDAYLRTWMTADGSECWLMTWLPQALPLCRILSVSYDSSVHTSSSRGQMDLYLLGEDLAYSLIKLANVGQSCPVLLVGHCVGGLVLKQVCIQAQRMGLQFRGPGVNPHSTFLNHMKGIFFYATPHLGSKIVEQLTNRSLLIDYLIVYCKETARINQEFAQLRLRHRWVAVGVSEGAETADCTMIVPRSQQDIFARFGVGERSTSTFIVEEASARFDSEEFSVLPGEDHFSICRPKNKYSSSFLRLLAFVDQVMKIEEIGEQIFCRSLRYTRPFLDMSRVEKVIQNLQLEQASPSRLALVGMSGIGKTTLAKEVFISIKSRFDFICFIEDVSDKLKSRELSELMAMHLFHGNGGTVYLQGGVAHSVWYLLKGRQVLMILDGVEDMKEIGPLLDLDWCSEGSRLIITTCIQSPEMMSYFFIHNVSFLSENEARHLFLKCLKIDVTQNIPGRLVDAVVQFCDGLPLLVVVLGGYLSTKKQEHIWEGVLRKLDKAESINDGQEKLISKLRVSFDELNETEQMIFLDLTLFDGYDLELLISAWESILSPGEIEISLELLIQKSLLICDVRCWFQAEKSIDVKVSGGFRVKVHQQLREMGWRLLRPASEAVEMCKGVWQLQDFEKLLTQEGKKSQVELISLEPSRTNHRLQVDWECIGRLGKLRFLQLKNVNFVGSCNARLPSDLTLLHLINCSKEPVNKLWEWVMGSTSWPLCEQDIEGLKQLAVLLLEDCRSVRLPNNFHDLQNLKVLRIQANDMTRLPHLFGHLPALHLLSLDCPKLQQLPPSFLHLPELRELKLIGCSALNSWPVLAECSSSLRLAFAPLVNLTYLSIEGASSLTELPDSFGQFQSLQKLEIKKCHALEKLPEGFGDLQQLESLEIRKCKQLRYLCQSFGRLKSLHLLCICNCLNFRELPSSFGHKKAFRSLFIDSCNALRELPESLGQLKNLTHFYLSGCNQVQSLPESMQELESLEVLSIDNCSNLQELPHFGQMKTLQTLWIYSCSALRELPESLGQLGTLTWFDLWCCNQVQSLPESMKELKSLKFLRIQCCAKLEHFSPPSELSVLNLCDLHMLKCLPDSISEMRGLRKLAVSKCSQLSSLPKSMEKIQTLKSLRFEDCPNLNLGTLTTVAQFTDLDELGLDGYNISEEFLASIGSHQVLRQLHLRYKPNQVPTYLQDLKSLESLTFTLCQVESLDDSLVNYVSSLTTLRILECDNLKCLPGWIGRLTTLSKLTVESCPQLETLPNSIGDLSTLNELSVINCERLKFLPESIGRLKMLNTFAIDKCAQLKTLPDSTGELCRLDFLLIFKCDSLKTLPATLGHLDTMTKLMIRGCKSLEALPGSLAKLRRCRVYVNGCVRITSAYIKSLSYKVRT